LGSSIIGTLFMTFLSKLIQYYLYFISYQIQRAHHEKSGQVPPGPDEIREEERRARRPAPLYS
jgi:hypothetical protein